MLTATGGLFKGSVWASPVFAASPFALGVAAGDPAPDGFVLWTKIAPRPFERGGGMPRKAVEVTWIVATDETPIPYSPTLEDAFLPSAESIVESVRARLGTGVETTA